MANEEALRLYLRPKGECPQIGPEEGRVNPDGVSVLKGVHGGQRYIQAVGGRIVAALQVMVDADGQATAVNVYTDPGYRRLGIASSLMFKAGQDLGDVALSPDLSPDGQAWVASLPFCGPRLVVDVPNEFWLQDQIAYAKAKGRNPWGVPYMGKVTASFRDRPVPVPVEVLAGLPGQRAEQKSVRQESLVYIRQNWDEVIKVPPYIEVAHNGEAWVNEGNHRIMVALERGEKMLPVTIRYFDGGERFDGPMAPDKLASFWVEPEDDAPPREAQRVC
jgi:hypothetical protein